MTAAHDRKVYDSDLAHGDDFAGRNNLLKEIARTYCREYVGNFDMMIEAKRHLARTGDLDAGMFRPVLNTLRCDAARRDLWDAVRALLPSAEPAHNVVPFERPPRREYAGHQAPRERAKATHLRVRVAWKVPFRTASRPVQAPVVHLLLKEADGSWWRPRLPDHDFDMMKPLEVFEVRFRSYCRPYLSVGDGQLFWRRPTYEDAFPGCFDPPGELMPFCRSCARLHAEHPELAVYQGDVE